MTEAEDKKRSCTGKKCHRTFDDAMKALKATGNLSGDLGLLAYRCRFCPFFHIGHPPTDEQKRLKFKRLINLIERAVNS